MNTPNWMRHAGRSINQNSPAIFSGLAVAGVVATAVLSVKATIEFRNRTQHDDPETPPKEQLKEHWRIFVPPAAAAATTIVSIVAANQAASRKHAALLSAYTLVDSTLREYKREVVQEFGEARERKVTDRIAEKKMAENPPKDGQIIITGGGDVLCYEVLTGRYFRSDIETVRQHANSLNREILHSSMYASLNEWFGMLGLGPTTLGEEVGFNIEHPVECVFTSHLADDGTPTLALGYGSLPVHGYEKVF